MLFGVCGDKYGRCVFLGNLKLFDGVWGDGPRAPVFKNCVLVIFEDDFKVIASRLFEEVVETFVRADLM